VSAPGVLVLAGLDPSGGAGLLADAETVRALGARPFCVATALTVQTTRAARRYQPVDADLVRESVAALLEEEDIRAVKVGMVGNAANARALAAVLPPLPRVVDPVLAATSGAALFDGKPEDLLALARDAVLTPNIPEAEALLGGPADASKLLALGPRAVLLKGGHLQGVPVDVLATAAGAERFSAPRIDARARGTGCRLASAIAAGLARGLPLRDSVIEAREHVRKWLSAHVPV
jgi:hydroxymethylpyrimidine/phosphomethylpyrimidine kinase